MQDPSLGQRIFALLFQQRLDENIMHKIGSLDFQPYLPLSLRMLIGRCLSRGMTAPGRLSLFPFSSRPTFPPFPAGSSDSHSQANYPHVSGLIFKGATISLYPLVPPGKSTLENNTPLEMATELSTEGPA